MSIDSYEQELERLKLELEQIRRAKEDYDKAIKAAYEDPELREPLRQILRKVAGLDIPDPPQEKYVKSHIESLKEEIKELKKQKEVEAKAEYAKQLNQILQEYGIVGDEVDKFKEFLSKTGLVPTNLEGWRIAAQNYRRSLVAEPSFPKPKTFKEEVTSEDFVKNPSAAFEKAFLAAMQGKRI